VQPSEQGDAIALTKDQLASDLEQNLTGVFLNPDPQSYPVSAYSYLITQEGQTPPPVGVVEADYVHLIACQGQQSAGALGYTPLPPNLVQDDIDAINRINQGGAPPLPPATAANCANPYLTGQLACPGGNCNPQQSGTPGASGTLGGPGSNGAGSNGPGSGTAGSGASGSGATGSGTTGPSSAQIAAEIAAAQKKAAEVAQASKERAATIQTPGMALLSQIDHLLGRPFSSGLIWLWTLLLVAVFAVMPAVIAVLGRRRRPGALSQEVEE
jgi:phosphate transport system substrate-binding protein